MGIVPQPSHGFGVCLHHVQGGNEGCRHHRWMGRAEEVGAPSVDQPIFQNCRTRDIAAHDAECLAKSS